MRDSKIIHEAYHHSTSPQKKIISENNFTYRLIVNFLNKYINNKKSFRILDVGCGAGTLAFYLASKGHKVKGIDISDTAIESCRQSAWYLGLKNVTFDSVAFPRKSLNGTYDFVLLTEVLEHLQNDRLAIRRINRLLTKKGLLFLTTPLSSAPLARLGLIDNFDRRVGHIRRYDIKELRHMLESNGFALLEVKKTEGIIRNFLFVNPLAGKTVRFIKVFLSDWVTFIDNISLKLFGASNVFIIARKIK